MKINWVSNVLTFWFCELEPKHWFLKSEETDRLIREGFQPLYQQLTDTVPADQLLIDARTALAAIIVLDQFPRNMFRGTSAAFGSDAKALDIAARAVDLGFDQKVATERRIFFYLPYEHSERLADQDKCIALVSALGNAKFTYYAKAHQDVIRKFGRFPHRNSALGRQSTPEEQAFLMQPGSGF